MNALIAPKHAPINAARWFIVLPPDGAARSAGEETIRAFSFSVNPDRIKTFDCAVYLSAFKNLLKNPEEAMVVDLLNHALIVQCLEFKATHILVLALSPVTLFSLNLLKEQHITTIHWFYEDFRMAKYWKDVLVGYQYFFAIQKGPVAEECKKHKVIYGFLPTAAGKVPPNAPMPQSATKRDAAFIGLPSPYRIRVLEFLAARGVRLAIAGKGWDRYQGPVKPCIVCGEWTDRKQSAEIVQSALIGINLSLTDPYLDRGNTHVSPRVFDVLSAGRVLVTEKVPLIYDVLPDCAFHCFSNETEALLIIRAILADPEKEKENILKNRSAVQTGHLYVNRVQKIVEIAG